MNVDRVRWQQVSRFWDEHRQIVRQMFSPVTDALVADANVERGYQVLDVGSGAGEPALTVAELVGSAGSVRGTDPASEMIVEATRAAAAQGLANVQFEKSGADRLPFASDLFDAIVSRFAVMFFPSPPHGVQEILRVLKPAHRVAFAVWSHVDRNPFHHILARVVDRYVTPEPVPEGSPGPFRFAAPGKLLAVLDELGFTDTRERVLQFRIEAPMSAEQFWDLRLEWADKLRTKLGALAEQTRSEIRGQVLDGFRVYSQDGGLAFPAEVLIVSGSKRR